MPKHCVLAGSSGTHTVCVFIYHENVKLMLKEINLKYLTDDPAEDLSDYRDCLKLCSYVTTLCHLGECSNCPGTTFIKENLINSFDRECIDEIKFECWLQTERCTLKTVILNVDDFVEEICKGLLNLRTHDFLVKQQWSFFNDLKTHLTSGEFVISYDFAENNKYVIQDAIQGFHFNNDKATIFTVVIYYIEDEQLEHKRQQLPDSEKLTSQDQPSLSDQHILFTPVFYISGNGGYVAAPSAGYTLPQQSGLQQPTVSAAASASAVQSQPPLQLLHGIQPAVTSGQQTDLYKMQPQSAQNIIITSNKKKKYTSNAQTASLATKQQHQQQQVALLQSVNKQQQYHINKGYNVVSISMSSNTINTAAVTGSGVGQQLQPQQHSYHLQHHQCHVTQHHQPHQPSIVNCKINQNFITRGANMSLSPAAAVAPSTGNGSVICTTNAVLTLHHNGQHSCPEPLNSQTIFNMSTHRAIGATGLNTSLPSLVSSSNGNNQIDTNSTGLLVGNGAEIVVNESSHNIGSLQGTTNVYTGSTPPTSDGGLITLSSTMHAASTNTLPLSLGGNTAVNAPSIPSSLTAACGSNSTSYITSTTIHDKINIGLNMGCPDSRKYDYKINKFNTAATTINPSTSLNNNYQMHAEYVPQSAANNSPGRSNQPAAGNIYRQNPSSPAPRSRYVHSATMYPAVHQSVVLGQFTAPYATRTPQLQQCQYSQYYPHMFYPYYLPPQQQRTTVNPAVGVGLSSAMAVQPGGSVSGPTAPGNQGQIPLGVTPVAASSVLSVGNTTAAQPVGVAPLVGMPHQPPPQQQQQNPPQTKGKLRSHALQIIHPITNRNILDDLDIDKNEPSNVAAVSQATLSTSVTNVDTPLDTEIGSLITSSTANKSAVKIPETSKSHTEVVQQVETSPAHQTGAERNFKETTQQQQQTPIVSAMTDAPSVEIFPTQPQKQKTKKSQNISMKQDQNMSQGKTEENIKQVSDVSTTSTTAYSNCVQESLPTNYINQQVPQQEQLKDKHQEENISSKTPSSPLKSSSDINNTISKQKDESKESCTEDYFGASEQEKSTIYNITESVKTMQLGEKETLTLPQQKQINIVNSNEQQEQEQQKTQYSNATNGNNITATLTESIDNNIVNNDVVNNNNNQNSNNVNKANVFSTNPATKLVKKNDNVTEKPKTVSAKVESGAADTDNTASNNTTISKDETRDETDRANIVAKNELESKQKVEHVSSPTNDNASTKSTKIENAEPVIDDISKESSVDNKEEGSSESKATDETAANNKQSFESLIDYNEGQWSPSNPSGKKQYNREQLMQLREAKASRIQPEVKNTSIFSQTNLMPAFASRGNKKVQSMVGGFGGARGSSSGDGNYQNNYMKQSSMSGRGGGDGGHHNRNSGKPIIHLNLSLNQDVKLNEADNAWRPSVLVQGAEKQLDPDTKAQREKDELIRRVRGILNKLTPEKFEPLVEEIIKLKIDTMEKMEAVMILVFEKAIDEPNFSVSYASLCHRLINEVKARDERMESGTKSNLAYFRSALLDKTEREFTQNVTKSSAKEEKLKPIREKIINSNDPNEKVELEALLDEEERKIRRRSGGTVRFIGELFKISILTGKIIHTCIEALLKDPNNEDMLECLCKLLTTVGQKFEQTNMPKEEKRKYSLESVIQRMQNIASKNENSKISSRVRFMLQDVIDLRKKNWQSTRNEAPKTMEQIEKEANNEQLSNPYHYMNAMSSGSGSGKRDGGGRNDSRSGNYGGSHSQRGDTSSLKRQQGGVGGGSHSQSGNSNNDDTWHVQTGKGNRTLAVDSSKLVGLTTVDMNNKKMGGLSLFLWPKTSSQPTTTPSNSFAALSMDSNRSSDRDRDRSGPRNKGSYNKGSMERDRYDHGRLLSRNNSTQASRENSSSRSTQGVRGMGGNSSNMQKSASHSKYQQPMSSSRMTSTKMSGMSGSGGATSSSLYRDTQQQSSYYGSNATHHQQQQHFNPAASESTQPSSAPPAVFEEPTEADTKLIKAVVMEMVENAANSKCIDNTTVSCIKKIKENQRCGLIYYILTDYLHLANVRPMCRRHLANVIAYLIENKYISVEHFRLAYKQFAEFASDLMVDIPELWLYIFEFTGPLIVKKLITVNDLWSSQLRESGSSSFSLKFLKTFIQYCTREVGPSFTRNMWMKNHIKWTDFMNENEVNTFIQTNKFEYVENEKCQPDIDNKEPKEKRNKRVVEHVDQLLKEGSNADNVIDYINGNIVDVDKTFIKSLTTTLTSFAIKDSNNYNLDLSCFQKICIPVLLRYLDSKEDLELECLYAIQLLVHSLEHPRGLLGAIFGELNDGDVIPQETFIAWRDSKDQSAGKGVAVKALNPFFNQVINGETSDDN